MNTDLLEVRRARHILSANGTTSAAVRARIQKCRQSHSRLRKRVWRSRYLKRRTKLRVYRAICRSTLLYGLECRALTLGDLKALERTQNSILRHIYRSPSCTSHLSNSELRRLAAERELSESVCVQVVPNLFLIISTLSHIETELKLPRFGIIAKS